MPYLCGSSWLVFGYFRADGLWKLWKTRSFKSQHCRDSTPLVDSLVTPSICAYDHPIRMIAKPEKEADVLLRTFLDEADGTRCDRLMEEIICQHARPIIKRVVASKLNVGRGRYDSIEWQEQEDIAEEVVVQLIRHLSGMRGAGADAFGSFENYVATAAYNACSNYLRRKYPERSRLRNRLRYILSHHEQLGMW